LARGFAAVFGEFSVPLAGTEPLREKIHVNAFRLLHFPVTVSHVSRVQIATTLDKSLRLWQCSHGLAFELDIPATPDGVGLRNMVASGFQSASFGLTGVEANYFRDENGTLCREVVRCDADHISVVERGAYSSSCCWIADTPVDRMSPKIAAASRHWFLGRIDRDQKRASNHALLVRLAAKAAAPAPRGPRGRAEPI
jgi:Caudovirus prohead serine protease